MAKITALSLHLINKVKLRRWILGIRAKQLSKALGHRPNYVQINEDSNRETSYPPHEYPKIADALACTVHDLLPPEESKSTGKLVDKMVLSLSDETDMKLVIEGLINYGLFDNQKNTDNVVNHLYIEKKDQVDLLHDVLNAFVNEGSLYQPVEDYYQKKI